MPPATALNTSRLRINLDSGPIFRPGDVISGHITRKDHLVSPKVRVTLKLRGRAKVKISVHRGQSGTSHYRARYNFFDHRQCPDTELRIFDGPLHIPPYNQATQADWPVWPFAITIPKHTHMNPHSNQGEEALLDPHRKDADGKPVLDPLPSSFAKYDSGFSTSFDSYIEYSLEATLNSFDSKDHAIVTATQPFTIRAMPPSSPIPASKLHRRSLSDVVKTQRLEPGMENAELGFRQKLAKGLSLGSVPAFGFRVEVCTPARVQLDAKETVPFLIKVVPQADLVEANKKLHEIPPVVSLAGLRMSIRSRTSVQAQGTLYPHNASDSEKSDLVMWYIIPSRVKPIELPVGPDVQALDIGTLLGLRMGVVAGEVLGRQVRMTPKLAESFRTYCIEHKHTLCWEIVLEIAQETKKFNGEVGIELLEPPLASEGGEVEVPLGGSRAAYEDGLAPPPEEVGVDGGKSDEQPPAYEK